VLFHALPVLAGDERYIAVTGVDITARKVAEEAVRELLSRLQRLAAHLPGFLYQYRVMPDGRSDFPYAGPGIEAIYGMSPEEVTQDASRVFAVLHPDDLARIGASIQRSADTLTLWHESYRVQHRDGRLLWVEGHATPIRQADGSTLWHGYIHDVSERQHAEQAARDSEVFSQNVLDSVQSQIAVIDQTGTILTVNEAWRRFSRENSPNPGQPTPATEVGTNYLKVCKSGGDEALEAWTGILGVLERRLPSFYLEFPCPSPMGQFWFAMSVGPLSVGIKGAVIVHSDITARKQTEHDLQQQTEALARSNAELEQFAFVASHDLRQPLRMVNSYVQMLERRLAEQLDEDTRKMMHFATEGAERMDQMLVSLLEYSRVGRKGEPMAPLDSRAAVDEAMHFLAPAIAQTQATVRVSGDWPQVVASRDEFTRLWQNLIGNAVKYRAPERAPEIDITATPQADGCWLFCIADSGIGIDPVQFDRLFKVFQRLHTREQYEGNGIGLAVARKIVERHGGRIWVESGGAGLGCRFCFTLPAHRPGTGVAP
jgi:PAS domain S-box-containing protein